jgi:pyruvate/2-oxoacid:ferredoxin oxidoreductase alpha subunit
MAKKFMKGNDAIIVGALTAGCRAYFGYPITPASEIAHAAALHFPALGGTFIQAESEVAAINMCYGTAGMGIRCMTASSSPGISLKQEGLSYAAGSELPIVFVNINRGGPGLGNIAPEQSDYFQATRGGGHGNYRVITLAPNSAQEMCDFTMQAFDLADQYRNPVCVLADGFIGQMMEAVELPTAKPIPFDHTSWCVRGDAATRGNLISSIYLDPLDLEKHNLHLEDKYRECSAKEVRFEEYRTDDAELVVVAYGIVSRIVYSTVDEARAEGLKVGLLRPITLWPFPFLRVRELAATAKAFLSVELNTGQMIEDVRLALEGRRPVHFFGRCGGVVPGGDEILAQFRKVLKGGAHEGH